MRRVTRTIFCLPVICLLAGCGAGLAVADLLPLPDTSDTVGPYVLTVHVEESSEVARARVVWFVGDGAAPAPLPLVRTEDSDRWEALMPGQPEGSVVMYRVEIETRDRRLVRLPLPDSDDEAPHLTFRVTPVP